MVAPHLVRHSCDIDLIYHQIEAVYSGMLEYSLLQFLLADDLGSGKAIVSGLLAEG